MVNEGLFDKQVSRRLVLGGAAGFGALGLASCAMAPGTEGTTDSQPSGETDFDVIVIGAGSSGIAAAREVSDAGLTVVVLEARDRMGGRMWTDHETMSVPHERGASLCHGGPQTDTWPWVEKLKLPSRKFENNMSRFTDSDPWVRWDSTDFYAFPEGTPSIRLPLPEALPTESANQYFERIGLSSTNLPLAVLGIQVDTEQFDAYPAAGVVDSLTQCFDVVSTGKIEDDGYAGDFKILSPYDAIINAVAEGIDVRLNTVVDTVEHTKTGVTVNTDDGAYTGMKCIVAIPIGVLQSKAVTFDPPLDSKRLKAIDDVQQTVACKTILEFDQVVRPNDFDMVNQHDHAPSQFWDESTGLPGYSGQLIVSWDTGDRARELLDLPEKERFAAALDGVRKLAGDNGLEFVNATNYDWRNDEFALGAYATGQRDQDTIYEPIQDTIYWAGAIKSSVGAAHTSGLEAAQALLTSI